MSILLKKGSGYNAEYASTDFPILSADWTGSVSLYLAYPGTAILTKALTVSGNKFLLALMAAEILNLELGVYSFVTTITNAALGVTITSLEYATVTAATAVGGPMTKLFMTIAKPDGTPAGSPTRNISNSYASGTTVVMGWSGLTLTVSHAVANQVSGSIIDIEATSTTTNAAGYAELFVIKGLTVTATCSGFGKSVTINTTGLDSVNLMTLFPLSDVAT